MVETKVSQKPIEIEYNSTKKNYLYLVKASEAAEIRAGLFLNPNSQA
jgi:hypothetical protein